MTAASRSALRGNCFAEGFSRVELVSREVRPVSSVKEMDVSNRGTRRGIGPSTYTRVAEIMSGRTVSQQGLAATCEDLARKGEPEASGGLRSGAWVRKSDEGGVASSEMILEVIATGGNALGGQRGPGHSVADDWRAWEGMAGFRHNLLRRTLFSGGSISRGRRGRQTSRARGASPCRMS